MGDSDEEEATPDWGPTLNLQASPRAWSSAFAPTYDLQGTSSSDQSGTPVVLREGPGPKPTTEAPSETPKKAECSSGGYFPARARPRLRGNRPWAVRSFGLPPRTRPAEGGGKSSSGPQAAVVGVRDLDAAAKRELREFRRTLLQQEGGAQSLRRQPESQARNKRRREERKAKAGAPTRAASSLAVVAMASLPSGADALLSVPVLSRGLGPCLTFTTGVLPLCCLVAFLAVGAAARFAPGPTKGEKLHTGTRHKEVGRALLWWEVRKGGRLEEVCPSKCRDHPRMGKGTGDEARRSVHQSHVALVNDQHDGLRRGRGVRPPDFPEAPISLK